MKSAILLAFFCSIAPSTAVAQTDFFHAWENRVRATSAKQPAWPVPVIGSPSTIVQLARTDFVRQYTSTHTHLVGFSSPDLFAWFVWTVESINKRRPST